MLNLLHEKSLIGLIVADETHLAIYYGKTFGKYFDYLKSKLYSKVSNTITLLFMTIPHMIQIKKSFESLIGVPIDKRHCLSPCQIACRCAAFDTKHEVKIFSIVIKY